MHIIYFKSEIILSVASVGSLLSCLFFPDKVVKLIRGGSVINGATPSSFNIIVFTYWEQPQDTYLSGDVERPFLLWPAEARSDLHGVHRDHGDLSLDGARCRLLPSFF